MDDVFAAKSLAYSKIFLNQTLGNHIEDSLCSVKHLLLSNFDFVLPKISLKLLVLVFAVVVSIILVVLDPRQSPSIFFNNLVFLIETFFTYHLIFRVRIFFKIILDEFLWAYLLLRVFL